MTIRVRKAFQSNNVIGLPVKNPEKEDLGTIEEVVIDIERGTVAYVVLSFSGFFGFSEKFFAIPWSEFNLEHGEDGPFFLLDTDRKKLSRLPGFNKQDWPDRAAADWDAAIDDHYQSDEERDYSL